MTIYRLQCESCGHEFNSSSAAEDHPECPKCNSALHHETLQEVAISINWDRMEVNGKFSQ